MNKTTYKNDASYVGKLIGIEIEYYPRRGGNDISNTVGPNSSALIEVVNDGTPSPAGRIKEIRLLTLTAIDGRIHDVLNLPIDGKVDRHCGLHIHIDARHLGKNGLLTAEQTYDKLVGPDANGYKIMNYCFKKLVPKSRHNNRYCKWRPNRSYGGSRYVAFNFQSFREHGTIEFRMQGGTTNKTKIETWALLCQFILNYVAKPENQLPKSWKEFLAILPEDLNGLNLRAWANLRQQIFAGQLALSPRVAQSLVEGVENDV